MDEAKNFIAGLIVALIFSFNLSANAEKISPYFSWDIKNYNAYSQTNIAVYGIDVDNVVKQTKNKSKFFTYDVNIGDIEGTRQKLYAMISRGEYFHAAQLCEIINVYQKIIFGTHFFDENLAEPAAKLYLITDEFDKAERKINLLLSNSNNNLTTIRALNLKSNLLNRRGKFQDALQVTQEVEKLLRDTPDENLNLINLSRTAQAYCGLGDIEKSLTLAEKIYPKLQENFGAADIESLALMSTVAENYLKAQRQHDSLKILLNKYQIIFENYGSDNLIMLSKIALELANYFFEVKDIDGGEEFLKSNSTFATRYVDNENYHEAMQLYKALHDTATKHLDDDNLIVLKSEFGLAQVNYNIGNIPQSIELCKKILPRFKKIFGEENDETLALMKILSDDYLLIGNYSDAKKIVSERLNICKKNFGENDARTIQSTIDLANIFYRTGKYKTADKLLGDLDNPTNRPLFNKNIKLLHNFLFMQFYGKRMKGENLIEDANFFQSALKFEVKGTLNISDSISLNSELLKYNSLTDVADDMIYNELGMANIAKLLLSNHHPKILEMMLTIAERHIRYGELNEAERYANQILELSKIHFGENNFYEWRALCILAKIRRAEENFSDALKFDNQALKIAEKVCGKNSLERLQSLDAIADDYSADKNFAESIKIREKALKECQKILEDVDAVTIQIRTNLAADYVVAERYSDAVKLCDETLALQKVPVYIGEEIFAYKPIIDLIKVKAQAQKLSGDDLNSYANYKKLVKVYEGQRASAAKNFSSAEIKTKWFAGMIPVYKDAATVAVSNKVGDNNFAFYCMEFCKGRNLIERYEDILVTQDYLLTDKEKNNLNEYKKLIVDSQNVSEYAKSINDAELFSNSEIIRLGVYFGNEVFKNNLREKYSESPAQIQNIWKWDYILKNFDIDKNRQAIPNGACLIEFMKVSDDSLLVTFLRNEGDIQAVNIPVDGSFFEKCKFYYQLTAENKFGNDELNEMQQKFSVELSEKLMPTLEKFAGNSSYWIISPDAELNLVPFETLIYHEKFLVQSKNLSYVPSLAVMNLMKNREIKNSNIDGRKDFFAMGDAIYTGSLDNQPKFFNKLLEGDGDIKKFDWKNLEGTAQELDKISVLFESKDIFRREQATEKNLRKLNASGELAKYKYLLFAAHGIFIPQMPEYNSIVLSQQFNDANNDGYITVGEWFGYDLRSNLIYLSACESGLGGEQAGEGIIGLPYALTVAGNKDTVMTLWKVSDTSTAEFTFSFFEKIQRGHSEVSALNETKREFIKHNNPAYRNPKIWAPFLLYGI